MATSQVRPGTRTNGAFRCLRVSLTQFVFPILLVWALAGSVSSEQNNFDKREAAYRANNLGVARLEQYKPKEAAESFERSLGFDPDLRLAQINLCIALYYLPDPDAARRAADKALASNPYAPQPHYILGLIARTDNRYDDAIKEFQSVLAIDNEDAATNVNIGQIYVQEKKYEQAIPAFRKALDAEPYNEAALYNLGILLTRTGAKEEGQRTLRKFQQLQQSGAGTKIGTAYLEGGHYAEAIVSTGAESDLVDRATPDVKFVDATSHMLQNSGGRVVDKPENKVRGRRPGSTYQDAAKSLLASNFQIGATVFDLDNDGDLDLLQLDDNKLALWRNDKGKFVDITSQSSALNDASDAVPVVAVAGDYDNDGLSDLLVVRNRRISLYHNEGNGKFSDRSKQAGIPDYPFLAISAAFVDVDHDGDLDIFVAGFANLANAKVEPLLGNKGPFSKQSVQNGPRDIQSGPAQSFEAIKNLPGAPNLLLRNNANGTFTDITEQAKVRGAPGHAVAIVPTDFNNHRDVDLLVTNYGAAPQLFSNERDGSFRDVTKEAKLDVVGNWTCVAAGDLNKDGFTDFFFGRGDGAGLFALSDGRSHFKTIPAPATTARITTAQFLDYDDDGLLDLVAGTDGRPRLWRNVGNDWIDASGRAMNSQGRSDRTLSSGDFDDDGDVDLILRAADGALHVLRNDGGNRNHSLKVDMHGHVSNRSAVEAKVEMRAGSLYQKLEVYSASPAPAPSDLIFGLGKREKPDAVRVLWPAGIVQAETEFPAASSSGLVSLNVTEIDRKPSSCPYLYAWNGKQFEFITDFMGGGEMGYLESPGRYNIPDPVEYVRMRNDQLKAKDGRYELRVTNELEEAMFVDRLQLLVVNHSSATEVYPNEGMSDPPKRFELFVTKDARPPASAVDDKGNDVLDLISRMDRRWPDDFKTERIRGYAAEHSLTLRLNRESNVQSPKSKVLLLLTGWTDYAWSSDNVAAIQSGREMQPPSLQVKDRRGKWQTVIKDIGIPVGRPQTVTVDLTGKFLSADREVRIVTNMRVYWDQILVDTSDRDSPRQITRLDPVRADLHWRGFSAETSPDNREPWGYDYRNVSFTSPWKVMTGRYTREGDVRELLLHSDDMFVVSRPGDEIILSFDAASLTPLPPGWTRTFLLYADGFSKEMDINSASPDQLAPLPFHGMSHYPYRWPEHYPLDVRHREYLDKYNTRLVTTQVPRLAALGER
jgi:tetratricopeptide (TPR) repeat protein